MHPVYVLDRCVHVCNVHNVQILGWLVHVCIVHNIRMLGWVSACMSRAQYAHVV